MRSKRYDFEVPEIDEFDFIEALFKPGETWGDLWTRIKGTNCDTCPFQEKCDKLYEFIEKHDTHVYCEDLINIMIGLKQVDNFLPF
jgi:hypothetical protein